MERWRWCVVITPPHFFCVMWPKVHFCVMSSTSKITKRDKQMYLIWTVPITHLRHAFIQCCASFPLLRWEYLYAMAAAIKNMDSAVTWPRYQTKKSEGSRVPDYIIHSEAGEIRNKYRPVTDIVRVVSVGACPKPMTVDTPVRFIPWKKQKIHHISYHNYYLLFDVRN